MNATEVAQWKDGSRYRKYPLEPIRNELEKIRQKHDGELNPSHIVEAARTPRSPLHKLFLWDDSVAAHQYRLNQAGTLVRSIVIVRTAHPELGKIREYEVTPGAYATGGERRSFRKLDELLADDKHRPEVLKRAMNELLVWQRKFRGLQELAVIVRHIDELLESIKI